MYSSTSGLSEVFAMRVILTISVSPELGLKVKEFAEENFKGRTSPAGRELIKRGLSK